MSEVSAKLGFGEGMEGSGEEKAGEVEEEEVKEGMVEDEDEGRGDLLVMGLTVPLTIDEMSLVRAL